MSKERRSCEQLQKDTCKVGLQAIGYYVVVVHQHSRSNRRPVESKLQVQEKIDQVQSLPKFTFFNSLDLPQLNTIPL
jgi:hypothetical protein